MTILSSLSFSVYRSILLILLLCLGCHVSDGQAFRNLAGLEGASMSNAKGVVQDRQGFMWFATYAGLFRYDAHTIKRYLHNAKDSGSISSDMLSAVFCDSRGDLWIGGSGGLDRYNRETDNFTHIDHNLPNTNPEHNNQIYFISEDRDHRILVGTPFGMNSIVTSKNGTEVRYILHRVFQGPSQDIASVSQTENGDFWAGSYNGMVHVPGRGMKPRLFRVNSEDKSPLINQFFTQYLDDRNVIWLGPGSGGIVEFDIATEKFTPISDFIDPDGSKPVVSRIIPDGTGKLWMATHAGLALFDPRTRKATWYRNQPGNIYSLADNHIQAMCLDRQGGVWVGTYYFGISHFYPNAPRFLAWPLTANGLADVQYANAWMGTSKSGKLWVIRKDQKKLLLFDQLGFNPVSYDLTLRSSTDYYRFYFDDNDVLWAAGNSMLTSYNLKTHDYHDYPTEIQGQKELEDGRVHDILEDSRGRFWLIGTFGALLFDKDTGRFKKYESVSYAHSILEDTKQNIWIGGGDEAFMLDRDGADFKELLTDKTRGAGNFASVWRLAEDRVGRIWAVTRQGLQFFDPKSGRFKLDPKVSLSKIEDIQIDQGGYLWLATEAELTRYHPDKQTLQTYGYQDGLPFNGISRPASSVQLASGMLYFTTNKGIFQFAPGQVIARKIASPLVFTTLRLSDSEVKAGDHTGLLHKTLDQTDEITLKYDQNIFSVDFALLSFPRAERNRYAYKLEGFDESWSYTDNQSVTYMNLPRGSYILRVRAANGDGYWMQTTRQLHIRVLPPWWLSWYAYITYLLLAGGSVFLLTRFLWLRTALRKENELHQAKLDFFTNISHEIRTHLALIVGPLEKAFSTVSEDSLAKNHLHYARNNSGKLMQLVDELLDFRKIQNGSVKIQVQKYDLVRVLKNIISSFEHLGQEKDIEITFNYPEDQMPVWFDLIQMQKVFYNLLSNAYKFTPEGGHISLDAAYKDGEIAISVTDNGLGIAEDNLEHLFKNFFQVTGSNDAKKGYGIGLALAKQIVELHQGQLKVTSRLQTAKKNGKTCFTITLKRGHEHYSEDQFGKVVLPITSFLPERLRGVAVEAASESHKSQTILLIEDNDELRSFEKDLLREHYQVLEAANGAEGLEMAFEHIPDLILCDVMMPELSGLEVCAKVKTDSRTSHIPVILLTARTALSQVVEGLQAGADDYLVKPFDPTILELKIGNAIRVREELQSRNNSSLALGSAEDWVQNADSELILKLRNLILENLDNPDFGVYEMAFQFGMSVSVLYRKLRALTGKTVNDFVKTIRMQRALQLVESGHFQVSEVALKVGFEDVKYFSREFRKVYGKTPSQVKNQPHTEGNSR